MTVFHYKTDKAALAFHPSDRTLVITPLAPLTCEITPEAIEDDSVPYFSIPKKLRARMRQGEVCVLKHDGMHYYLGHWNKECDFIEYRFATAVPSVKNWRDHTWVIEGDDESDDEDNAPKYTTPEALKEAFERAGFDMSGGKAEAYWKVWSAAEKLSADNKKHQPQAKRNCTVM